MKTILVDAVNTFVIKGEGVSRPMLDLLEGYQNKKIIVTNADDGEMEKFGLNGLPYEVYTLKHNPDKTDPKYFEKFFEDKSLSAEDVIYFEHNPEAVRAAQSLGITSYYYDHSKKDLGALKNFLDTNL
ncbi:MAG: hypothetical protein U9M92_01255 [Patescibacteria group bacterium]|nr:hypothetical protein [Patescibacteria group bacterium]